ncbi:hypothetical protein MKW94_008787 [Papaver nudicaule]|uniref:Isopenicillin N synthase-like Fe(2+) 2OG dioxygenase domain-containing protein n=1 Tax=Papaver nudicaule TaxID=74823 RepID=A0AA41RV77_PAPNU|nr:hypothetical protein [Papaver nudicaule]
MEIEAEILDPFQLHYSDLILLSSVSTFSDSSEQEDIARLDSISKTILETLGPTGPGLLVVTGVPQGSQLRSNLLPFARQLALLNPYDCRRILKDHGLGTDVCLKNPDRAVSSFAFQLKYVQDTSVNISSNESVEKSEENSEGQKNVDRLCKFQDDKFKKVGNSFKELGFCLMDIGLQLARMLDKAIGGKELEQSILESRTAKGRLIHYHSTLDHHLLIEAARREVSVKGRANCRVQLRQKLKFHREEDQTLVKASELKTSLNEATSCRISLSNLWQQWHYDYGIFTILTTPMFMSSYQLSTTEANEQECSPPDGHINLLIFDANKNKIYVVRSPPNSFVVQVGESADILSKGKLHSTLHSVCRPTKRDDLSRDTFVVFLQPAWDKRFSISQHPVESRISDTLRLDTSEQDPDVLNQEIHRIIPALSSRLKDGMTFAEFSHQTTKQYYGGNGVQSKRKRGNVSISNQSHWRKRSAFSCFMFTSHFVPKAAHPHTKKERKKSQKRNKRLAHTKSKK